MVTMKFGGTSVQDADAISNAIRIVKDSVPRHPVVVISAIARATNSLEHIGRWAAAGALGEAVTEIDSLIERHRAIVGRLIADPGREKRLRVRLSEVENELRTLAAGVGTAGSLTPRVSDAICSQGELLSSLIVAAALEEEGIPSFWLDTKDFLITDDRHTRARPLMTRVKALAEKLILPVIREGRVPVTQGFIGATAAGVRTTMGRESSDYTGALIGGLLGAEAIEIWTDVTGVLSADPVLVPVARQINHLSFREAYELTIFGAKVLHPKTMEPARAHNVPIYILNSRSPEIPGTVVSSDHDTSPPGVKSVACRKNVGIVTVSLRDPRRRQELEDRIHGILVENGSEILITSTSEFLTSIVCTPAGTTLSIPGSTGIPAGVDIVGGKGLISVVGRELVKIPGLPERLQGAVGGHRGSICSFSPSGDSLCLVIDETEIDDAVRRVHAEFIEPGEHAGR